jgi:DNA-binding NarL/FixJ family response regulator
VSSVYAICEQTFARLGLAQVLSTFQDLDVLGVEAAFDTAASFIERRSPDVVVVDVLGSSNPVSTIKRLRRICENSKIIVLCPSGGTDFAVDMLDAGATGILTNGCEPHDLGTAIRRVLNGDNYIQPDIAIEIFNTMREADKKRKEAERLRLTLREGQVVNCLMQGMTNRQIADELTLSEKTVKHYVGALKDKLCAANRLEIVLEAQRLSL